MPEAQQQRRTIMGETRDTDWIEAVERERRAKREAIAAALIPLLRIYGDGALPEAFYATVEEATGFRGDNHSSGGTLRISFVTTESGTNDATCVPNDIGGKTATLTARGDLEQDGLIRELALLLAKLLPIYHPQRGQL
jgi:hypothetical protein